MVTPIGSMVYWIRRANFRPRDRSIQISEITLGEIIDMYHSYDATVQHDKVYALLGMSSDNPSPNRLRPDYAASWANVFQELIKFLLSDEVEVCAFDGKVTTAIIKSKGFVLGEVLWVGVDSGRPDKQQIEVMYTTPVSWEFDKHWNTTWTVQASARSVQRGDIVCILKGASRPMVLRMYEDYADVIMICPLHRHGGTKIKLPRIQHEEYYEDSFSS